MTIGTGACNLDELLKKLIRTKKNQKAAKVYHPMSTHKKLSIGVLMGGRSIECEVSFNSGRTICDHLDSTLYTVIPLFQKQTGELYQLPWHFLHRGKTTDFVHRLDQEAQRLSWDDLKKIIDFMHLALHGHYGEDGTIQGALEVLGIPYLGSKVLESAFSMDKAKQQEILKRAGIAAPRGYVLQVEDIQSALEHSIEQHQQQLALSFPLIVKPSQEGSSLGVSVAHTQEQLIAAIRQASTCDSRRQQAVLVQEKIEGLEFVCVSLQRDDRSWYSLPLTEVVLEPGAEFYDYDQKYMPGRASKITPARCTPEQTLNIQATCQQVAQLFNFSTIIRIDGFLKPDGSIIILDLNTLPGTAPSTFLFHQAAEVGMNHTQLINHLITQELRFYGGENMVKLKAARAQRTNEQQDAGFKKNMRIGVLLGGTTHEREISLESGRNVCYKLSPEKYDVTPLFVSGDNGLVLHTLSARQLIQSSTRDIEKTLQPEESVTWSSLPELYDFIFIGLHGGRGENGSVQALLEMLDMPYNGSGISASGLAMDKVRANAFLSAHGIHVPKNRTQSLSAWDRLSLDERSAWCADTCSELGVPLIVKPHDDGCSVMVNKIHTADELAYAITLLFSDNKTIALIEECIEGIELTCGVIGNDEITALPPSEVVTKASILTLEEKFLPGQGENQTPARISAAAHLLVQETMRTIYKTLGCRGYARIDCFYQDALVSPTGETRIVFIECNTLPGLTPATCIFHQAAEIGMRPMEFIDKLVMLGLAEHRAHAPLMPQAQGAKPSTP